MMASGGSIFFFIYFSVCIAISIYLLVLAGRFVVSHERIASALERIADNQRRDAGQQH